MTKQVRVYVDTAHAISVIASTLSARQGGGEVVFADIVDKSIQVAFPELYAQAMATLEPSKSEKQSKN